MALYATYLVDNGIKSSILRSYISAIKKTLEIDGYRWDDNIVIFTSLTRACKLINDKVRKQFPIKKGLLELILIETNKLFVIQMYLNVMYKAMFSLAYFGMMRVGEITTGNHPVKAGDIHTADNKDKLKIYLYTSKTHGRESRPQEIKIQGRLHDDMCGNFDPYVLINNFLQMRGRYDTKGDALFIFRDGTPVKPTNFRNTLKLVLKRLNLNPKLYDTHSFRIGWATDLMKAGYSIDQIKHLGRWKSNVVYKYLRYF